VKEQAGIGFEFVQEFIDRDRELRKLLSARSKDNPHLRPRCAACKTIASN